MSEPDVEFYGEVKLETSIHTPNHSDHGSSSGPPHDDASKPDIDGVDETTALKTNSPSASAAPHSDLQPPPRKAKRGDDRLRIPIRRVSTLNGHRTLITTGDGHFYQIKSSVTSGGVKRTYVKCKWCSCKAALLDQGFITFIGSSTHSHEPDLLYETEQKLRKELLQAARESSASISAVFKDVCNRYPSDVNSRVSLKTMSSSMARARSEIKTLKQKEDPNDTPYELDYSGVVQEVELRAVVFDSDGSETLITTEDIASSTELLEESLKSSKKSKTSIQQQFSFREVPTMNGSRTLVTVGNGHFYKRNGTVKSGAADRIYIKCKWCSCSALMVDHRYITFPVSSVHTHEPDLLFEDEQKLRCDLIKAASETSAPFSAIYEEVSSRYPNDVKERVSLRTMASSMLRARTRRAILDGRSQNRTNENSNLKPCRRKRGSEEAPCDSNYSDRDQGIPSDEDREAAFEILDQQPFASADIIVAAPDSEYRTSPKKPRRAIILEKEFTDLIKVGPLNHSASTSRSPSPPRVQPNSNVQLLIQEMKSFRNEVIGRLEALDSKINSVVTEVSRLQARVSALECSPQSQLDSSLDYCSLPRNSEEP